jgi:hypothetical protein
MILQLILLLCIWGTLVYSPSAYSHRHVHGCPQFLLTCWNGILQMLFHVLSQFSSTLLFGRHDIHNSVSVCLDLIQGHFQSEMPLHRLDSQHLHSHGCLKLRMV